MSANQKRILTWTLILAVVAGGITFAFLPRAITVDLITAQHVPMIVTVDEEAKTRVHDVFVLSAPVAGHLKRIDVHVGDTVVANETLLASIEPGDPQFLDPRSEAQARAAIQTAESALALASAKVEQAAAEREFADTEYRRARTLIVEGTITKREFDNAERAFKTTRAALATTQAALQMRTFELEQAKAALLSPADTQDSHSDCACVTVTAPISGQVLSIPNTSERVVTSGEPLLEIGNPTDLEIVADYLSTDTVQMQTGQHVNITNWGGDTVLKGAVRRVEPFGFTKVSALGIEEQRVNVIIDLTSPKQEWVRLGHGYQVETQVVLWKNEGALAIPLTALFRNDDIWAVFVNDNGRAALREVELGRRNGLAAEIIQGVEAGERIVAHPSDRVIDGVRISSRG